MQGADHEAVVSPPQMGRNDASAVRSARPKGKKCRLCLKENSTNKATPLDLLKKHAHVLKSGILNKGIGSFYK